MANELTRDDGLAVTLIFAKADPAANATTQLALAQGGAGFLVPAGYAFHPVHINGVSNAALTAGTATYKVCRDGTALVNGPTAGLDTSNQKAGGVQRIGADPIAAAAVVGVVVVTSSGYLPTTADHDVMLVGVLLPA